MNFSARDLISRSAAQILYREKNRIKEPPTIAQQAGERRQKLVSREMGDTFEEMRGTFLVRDSQDTLFFSWDIVQKKGNPVQVIDLYGMDKSKFQFTCDIQDVGTYVVKLGDPDRIISHFEEKARLISQANETGDWDPLRVFDKKYHKKHYELLSEYFSESILMT